MTLDITDAQIEQLLREGGAAGDEMNVACCRIALGTPVSEVVDSVSHLMDGPRTHLLALTAATARAECARQLDEARAMLDDE